MFDQNSVVEALLRPDYARIKEIEAQIAALIIERDAVGKDSEQTAVPAEEASETPPTGA